MPDTIGDGIYGHEKDKYIIDNWADYYPIVKEKYNRRIERFKNIINDPKPIIVLCNYRTNEIILLQKLLQLYYNRDDIYFINSSQEIFSNDKITNIYIEKNGIHNDASIWKEGIEIVEKKYFLKN